MLCTNCRRQTATDGDGRCVACLSTKSQPYAAPSHGQEPGLTPVVRAPAPLVLLSPVGLGRAVMVLLGVVALADVAVIAAVLDVRALFEPLADGDFPAITQAEAERADSFMLLTSTLQLTAYVATAVVFVIWFHRVRTIAGVLAPDLLTRGPGWTIGAWFIPVANLWIPRGIAAEVWTASRSSPYASATSEPRTPVNLWWAGFLVTWFATRFADRRYSDAQEPDEIVSATGLLVGAAAVDIAAAAFAIHFVHRLTAMQRARAEERAAAWRTGQPPAGATPTGQETPVPPMPQ
ncbi:DUF4328 domain-containing protein [Streptomyces peucetius]|uniref:DUF4328 domain-containing protein n=1 Tax=Streptomyces peucetius TaxID=1950 RepID=A0ABY6IAP4_STRPE|nr:DUF4328 domain-containing protein [Streptomyces peucetius]UYQ64077.1 DUF4328 domain-containing protein [Streptomyces peucetius]